VFCQPSGLLLSCLPPYKGRGVAVRAVHRSPVSGLEGYLAVFAARSADSGMHLSLLSVAAAIIARAIVFSGCSAVRTASGLVDEAFACEELLLTSVKGKT
jgi:hypothetical protein